MAARRLLLLTGQTPFDPTSGAAQATRQMAELLAAGGWAVEALSTSGCEGDTGQSPRALIEAQGGRCDGETRIAGHPVLRAQAHGISHTIVLTDPARRHHWEQDAGAAHAHCLSQIIDGFRPQVVLTFGDDAGDLRRRRQLRAAGARVVFVLHNLAYTGRQPADCDAFVCPSRFLAARYAQVWPAPPDVLSTPLLPSAVLADSHDPVFVTFINPEPAKGVALIARLAGRLGRERPDIPLLVVEGRARAAQLLAAGRAAGSDLARWPNLMFSPPLPRVADLWARTRVLLMPSVVEEAAGRAALEAMANGAVALVSDRGALPDTVGDSRCVLPADAPDAWFDALLPLCDDEALYARRSDAARRHAAAHLPRALAPSYDEWFGRLLSRPAPQ
jgi:glycosyltransferase involved in cell wall biosynthesis